MGHNTHLYGMPPLSLPNPERQSKTKPTDIIHYTPSYPDSQCFIVTHKSSCNVLKNTFYV